MSRRGKRKSNEPHTPTAAPPPPPPPEDDMDVDEEMYMAEDEEGGTRIGDIYIPPPVKPYCSSESIGPRLIIHKIVNYDFKSYAGEVVLGPFCTRFQAIIGPNGSGKSNVIDSMLFVFGYRANKIRCKKLSVLLHKSAKRNDTTYGRVSVYFQTIIDKPDGTYEVQPNSEFVISRTAYNDNSSFYTINDKRTTFAEVGKLLKSHNVDLDHNRFLILQGEVESIAMMKPKAATPNECGLLEYLEDIIGTSRYKEPLHKINERVEQLTEELTEKHNRCKLAEREMNELKEPKNEAIEYLLQENELTRTKNLLAQKNISEQTKILNELNQDTVTLNEELKAHDDAYKAIADERIAKEACIQEELDKYNKMAKKKTDFEKMLKNALDKYEEIHVELGQINKQRKTLITQQTKEEATLEEQRKIPAKNNVEIAECEKKLAKLVASKTEKENTLQTNLAQLQTQTQPIIDRKEKLETELVDLQRSVDECKSALALAESELKLCLDNEQTERRKHETLRSAFEEAKESFETYRVKMQELEESIPQLRQQLENKQMELQRNKEQETVLVQKIRAQRAEIESKSREMQAAKSNNRVLDALMRQKVEGKIPGILGRLGDLGGIDSKYDVAISTCCGRLDNIVVDTVDTAQACIQYLKKADVGRATFIALEKVAHLADKARQPIRTPENAPRLFDLIRVEDQRVLAAFYFALRDTLVATDLDQGTRIAYGAQRFRVVSLLGDVIETSGTMSGGGRSQIRGRMGQQVKTKTSASTGRKSTSAGDVEALQIATLKLQEQLSFLQEQQGVLEREINQLQQQLRRNESELKRMTVDTKSLRENLPHQERMLQAQKVRMDQTKADPVRVAELEKIKEAKTKLFEASQAKAKKVSTKVKDAQKEIDDITGEQVNSIKKAIGDLTKQISKLTTQTSKLSVEITTSVRNVTKSTQRIESLKEEIEKAEESIRKGVEARDQSDKDATELKERIKTITAELGAAHSDSSECKKEITALEKKEAEGKIKRLEFEQRVETLEKKIQDVNNVIPYWKNKLKPLKLNKIPTDSDVPIQSQLPPTTTNAAAATPTDGISDDAAVNAATVAQPDQEAALKTYTEEQLAQYTLQDLQYKISVQEEKIKNKPNLKVIEEYFEKRRAYMDRVAFLEEITLRRNEMRQLYSDVKKKRYTEFTQGFSIISKKLKEMYQMITQGGDAELDLIDSMDPFTEGVSFGVRPPKKSWKLISNLSGGEKTLSSLALVFALHYYKPSPMYFMDEIDAALDFRNVSIVANYIKARTRNAQFIIISLRSNMFELADFLTGIYKVTDCTQSITIRNTPFTTDDNANAQRVPDINPQMSTQAIFDELRQCQGLDNSIVELTQTDTQQQQQQDDLDHDEQNENEQDKSLSVSVLMDVES